MNRKIIVVLSLLILAGAIALFAGTVNRADTPAPNLAELPLYDDYASAPDTILGNDILFSIPVGKDGITYEGLGYEQMPWGPSALKVDSDGDFWIADAAAHRLLEYDVSGNQLSIVDLSDTEIVNVYDFALLEDEVAILDLSANEPTIAWVDYNGRVMRTRTLPFDLEDEGSYTSLRLNKNGGIVLEKELGGHYFQANVPEDLRPMFWKEVSFPAQVSQGSDKRQLTISRGLKEWSEEFPNEAYGQVLLQQPADGSIFVRTDEVGTAPDDSLDVDSVIRRYDSTLRPNGVARILPDDHFVFIEYDIAITPDGSVYNIVGMRDVVYVLKLRFFRELPRVLPQGPPPEISAELLDDFSRGGLSESPTSCVSRSTMMDRAWEYRSNEVYLSSTNVSGSCSGRTRPHNLSSGSYISVPYDWGGFDSVDLFNYAMSVNRQAGDINTSTESCSRGVDCSGFVSRVWGLSSKYSTTTLPNVSTRFTSRSSFRQGDIANKAGVHTMMFYSNSGSDYAYWYEATTYNDLDKVVRIRRSWRSLEDAGYRYYRYNNVCN